MSKSKSKSRSRNGRQDGHRGAWSAASPTSGTNRITKDEPLAKDENRVMQGIARSFGVVASLDLVIWPGLGTLTMLKLNLTNFAFSLQYPATMQRCLDGGLSLSECQRAQTGVRSLRRYG